MSAIPETMKAVGYLAKGSIERDDALLDVTVPVPAAVTGSDLLVKVAAVSVNPIDTKLRRRKDPDVEGKPVILGFDAVGVVAAVGPDCTLGFVMGDRVYYAGDMTRPGTNSEYHLVDEKIAAHAPRSLKDAEAAALPLTSITAYEMLFHRLQVQQPTPMGGKTILVIGAAGGVGSMALQLLRAKTDMTIVATASRPETVEWVKKLGAHHVINHKEPLAPQIQQLALPEGAPGFVFCTTMTDKHMDDIVELIAPMGKFGLIDDPEGGCDIMKFKKKSISVVWELMFTRSLFKTPDMVEQHKLLTEVGCLVDKGKIFTTATEVAGKINAATLKKMHAKIESGTAHGKIVAEGF